MKQLFKLIFTTFSLGMLGSACAMTALEHRDKAINQKLIDNNVGYRYLEKFPSEMLLAIASYLDPEKDLSQLAQVNKRLRIIVEDLRDKGKAPYPGCTFFSQPDDWLSQMTDHIPKVLPTIELNNRLKLLNPTDAKSIVLQTNKGVYLPAHLARLKQIKYLNLKMPDQSDCISSFYWEKAQDEIIRYRTATSSSKYRQSYENFLHSQKDQSIIPLHRLLDLLPHLTWLKLTDDKQNEYHFKGREKIKDIQEKLKTHELDDAYNISKILQEFYKK